MNKIDLLGYLAGALVIISLIPQIVHSLKTKKTNDLSLERYIIYVIGIFLWLIYGFLISNTPMIVSNLFAISFASIILTLKIKYG